MVRDKGKVRNCLEEGELLQGKVGLGLKGIKTYNEY